MSTKSTMFYRLGLRTRRALVLGATAFVLANAALPVTSAQALTPNVQEATDHYFACLKLMFENPAEHARLCSPSRVQSSNASLLEPVIGAPPPPPTVTPPPPPPPPPKCEKQNGYNGGMHYRKKGKPS